MSIVQSVIEHRASAEVSGVPLSAAAVLEAWGGGMGTATGRRVSEATALNVGAVYTCTLVLSHSVASLPLPLLERQEPRGRKPRRDLPLWRIVHDAPNPWMSSYTFRECLQGHLCLWGNAFAEIMRDANGRVTGLFPLRPDRMKRPTLSAAGSLIYEYTLPNGRPHVFPQSSILHLKGLSSDGLWGYSPIALQREGLGLAQTAEEFAARFFGNSAQPGGILSTDKTLSPEAAGKLVTRWNAAHQGLTNAHRVAVLEEGLKWQQIGMPLKDAEFISLRQYQRSEIAGWFRIPPHMIGDVTRSTSWGSGIEQQTLGFVNFTLTPWLTNWEQALALTLLSELEQRSLYFRHSVAALLRGDAAARAAFYKALSEIGALSPNDIRELEDQNPVEDGDQYFYALNYAPLGMLAKLPLPTDPPGPRPAPEDEGDEGDDEEDEDDE
jgi:HK97 family phage portal protein